MPCVVTCLTGKRCTSVAGLRSLCVLSVRLAKRVTVSRRCTQVRILVDDARVRLANQVNLASALRTALLLLPESFTEVDLFETIAGLSYRGDFRMAVGENPRKVRNIVDAQLVPFQSLYGGLLKSFWKSVHVIGERPAVIGGRSDASVKEMRQDVSDRQRATVAAKLPVGLRNKLLGHYERKWNLARAQAAAMGSTKAGGDDGPAPTLEQEMDQQRLWERIVADDEFQTILSKSECRRERRGHTETS